LSDGLGRVLAEAVTARADVPPHDNSAMDGFAVRAADLAVANELSVLGEIAAGHPAERPLGTGQAYRIMTGAPIPAGADAVVMVENTEAHGDRVRVLKTPQVHENIRDRGEDVRTGQVVLEPGRTLGPAELGVLASLQRASVQVARRPEVAVLTTGDELCDLDEPLRPGAVPDTNSYAMAALVRAAGGVPRVAPIVRDDPAVLRAAIEQARTADLIVSTGGVSVGEHDHVKAVLAALGAELSLWRVNMKPGKPVAVARLGETPYYGLPGNPVSAMVAFLLFVRPAIRTALGCAQPFDLPRATAVLDAPLKSRGDRRSYLRARASFDGAGTLRALPMGRQGSHILTSMVGANALIVLDPGAHELPAGSAVTVVLIAPL
ncbi:MAG TPA: gephyrin-like molybdotransferase Glp, partial [Kofleriaceae bacterium]|nr:gephyrin-like molybdotransferase Glp [Kofleriaceae bacterium]